MNEITHIHLGRQSFTVSVDAHKALQAYLNAIKHQVGGKSAEVLKEVETRMAELLAERGIKGEKVVLLEDVEYLKVQLGSPKDFKDEGDESSDDKEKTDEKNDEQGPKRLFRDTDHGMVAGVAAGLGTYLGIDAIFVRLLFVILAFAGGWGILAYIILWLLVPEAKTTSDVLLMQGKPVTIDTLKKVVQRADVPGAASRAKTLVGGIIEMCMKVVLTIVGAAFAVAGSISLLAIVSTGIYVAFRGKAVFQEEIFPVGGTELLVTAMSLVASAILCLFLLLIGIAMIRRKWQLPGWAVASLVGVFFVCVAVSSAMLPDIIPKVRDRYRAARHTSIQQMAPFSELAIVGDDSADISYLPDSKYFVELRYLGEIDTKTIKASVTDQKLAVDAREFAKQTQCKTICLFADRTVEIIVHAPSLKRVTVEGGQARFAVRTSLRQSELEIVTNRTASVRLSHMYPATVAMVNNSSAPVMSVTLSGLKAGGVYSDVVALSGDNLTMTRADEIRLQTDQTCQSWEPFIYASVSPQRAFVNNEPKAIAEINKHHDDTKANIENCLLVGDAPSSESDNNYYHR